MTQRSDVERLTADCYAAMAMADKWRTLCESTAAELNIVASRLAARDAEIVRLKSRLADQTIGLTLRGWWCQQCRLFNGEEHSKRTECRSCGVAKAGKP